MNTVVLRTAMDPGEAEAIADELQAELPYRRLLVEDDVLADALAARGWRDEPLLLLVRDAHEADRRLFTATPTRAFATFEQGRPVAYALLIDGGRDGMLEDVYTTPDASGRGLAMGVIAAVLHAARAERHDLVFVPTDADGRARALYERLGFEPLAVSGA